MKPQAKQSKFKHDCIGFLGFHLYLFSQMKLYILFRKKNKSHTSQLTWQKGSIQNSFVLGIHLFSQIKPCLIFRMKNESTNITNNIQNWYRKCFIQWIPLFSKMKLQIFFRMKNEITSIAINIQKWFYKFFFSAFGRRGSYRYLWPR